MFTIIKVAVGSLGYLLLISLIFIGVYPLKTQAKPKLELSKMLTCIDSTDIMKKIQDELNKNGLDLGNLGSIEEFKNLNQLKDLEQFKNIEGFENLNMEELKNQELTPIPTDLEMTTEASTNDIQDPAEQIAKAGEAISKVFGSKSTTKAEYCLLPEGNKDTLKALELSLEKTNTAYNFGTANTILAGVNNIPFINLPELPTDTKTLLVRSSYCNRPLNLSDFYIFTEISAEGANAIVMYNIELQENSEVSKSKKVMNNLIQSGQFIKSKLYCNGK